MGQAVDTKELTANGRGWAWRCGAALWCAASVCACGQLPDAPVVNDPHPHGMVMGTVKDVGGTVVAGAHVSLVMKGAEELKVTTDAEGGFRFIDVATGEFALIVSEEGLQTESLFGSLKPGEQYEAPPIVLKVATASDSVEVTVTRQEIAEAEIKEQEKQRVAGILPNFFVSYNWKAAPLTAKQKFELGWRSSLDPSRFVFSAIGAYVSLENNDDPGFGDGWSGFGKRYGASLADATTAVMLRGAILPTVFHQDPRYFYKGHGSVWSRGAYAISTAFRARGDNGHWEVSSGLIADFASGAISNLYYAASDRNGAALTFENGAWATVGVAGGHLVQEFLFKHIMTGVARNKLPPEEVQGTGSRE